MILECPLCQEVFEVPEVFFNENKGYICHPDCNRATQYEYPRYKTNDYEYDDGN